MLTDLRDMLDAPTLKLPIGGKTYVVQACTADAWLRLQEINDRITAKAKTSEDGTDVATATGVSELEMFKMALGDTFAEMITGQVTAVELKHAGVTAYYWQLGNEAVAEAMWQSAGKAPAPSKPARQSSTRTSTAGATTTRKRASTKATTTPTK